MRLVGSNGHGVELSVVGYQFPDHPDPLARTSWLMIEGTAYSAEGSWKFRWAALTPDDAVLISEWLLMTAFGEMPVAAPHALGDDCDGCLHFAEPNLGFAITGYSPDEIGLRIELDLEFLPPWRPERAAGDPVVLLIGLPAAALTTAATDWDAEIADFRP
ncbi:MAG: hypothetical protein QOI74_4147 [Micromonosporaceae bacterium]|jgi:hypothetical protein|nr:hypothetical protein [Micromonosporaceae bacterium]MDT5038808.1 hypothetical protein [Micromonosporaceae bacterium]